MLEQLEQIETNALASLADVEDQETLEEWRVQNLGRSSPLMKVFDQLRELPKEERPSIGRRANQVKQKLEAHLKDKGEAIRQADLQHSLESERLDVTLPGRPISFGRLHPVTQTLRSIYRIFAEMGFQVYFSRDVETDEYNFQLLNFPPHHPAREMQDSFYVDDDHEIDNPVLLRTQTSPGQIHAMREYSKVNPQNPEPIRIILPGMCYRYEQITARAESQFTQVEGLAVGKNITFSDLKGTLIDFARRMFGQEVRTRFRASHFPFTEPKWISNVLYVAERVVQFVNVLVGWKSWAVGWSTRLSSKMAAMTPTDIVDLPSGWDQSASPCCATALKISVISGQTISDS
jgi:phenylalanyl-tRNA synthetase alpha chain